MSSPTKSATSVADLDDMAVEEGSATTVRAADILDARSVAFDLFEVYCEEMLKTSIVERRAFLVDEMQYMIRRLIMHQYGYGRLYIRTCIANIVFRICGVHAYKIPRDADGDDQVERLVDLSPAKWEKNIVRFEALRKIMLRNDATLVILPSRLQLDDDGNKVSAGDCGDDEDEIPLEDDEINEALESHDDFSLGYVDVMNHMKFHTCLGHLQPQLETAIHGEESAVIPHENIIAFESAIEEQFRGEDCKHARILNRFLEERNEEEVPHLKSLSKIKELVDDYPKMFDLMRFQHKFIKLIRRWSDLVLPVPKLCTVYCSANAAGVESVTQKPMAASPLRKKQRVRAPAASPAASADSRNRKRPPESIEPTFENGDDLLDSSSADEAGEKGSARHNLRTKTKALMKNVNDPLDRCAAMATSARTRETVGKTDSDDDSSNDGAKRVKTPSFRKKKKSTHKVVFDSDESEGEAAALSEVPARYKSPTKRAARREICVSRKNSPPRRKRCPFTDEEKNAIIDGVKRFGVGKWAEIKSHPRYEDTLRNRTSVQLKDKWRTMENQRLPEIEGII
mmetsp:Transcript_27390/g.58866  ORF Transcript_27390/g.58866 Transcript_27390/m.58866 type:complete len:568 (+) Transcript_27390:108-1811(+)